MQKHTHLIVGFGLSFFLLNFSLVSRSQIIQFLGAILGSIIAISPDWLDFKIAHGKYHRNRFTHNFLSPLGIISFGIGYLLEGWSSGLILWIVFESHIILDVVTFSGVYLGWSKKIHGRVGSKDIAPNLICIIIGCIFFLLGFVDFFKFF